jgi:hypothetical protein
MSYSRILHPYYRSVKHHSLKKSFCRKSFGGKGLELAGRARLILSHLFTSICVTKILLPWVTRVGYLVSS